MDSNESLRTEGYVLWQIQVDYLGDYLCFMDLG